MSKQSKPIEKRIEKFMSQLPSDDFLLRYFNVHYLVAEYLRLRNQSVLLGKCLKARFGGRGGNPAHKSLNAGTIDQYEYDLIWALVNVYQALFELIQMGSEDIKAELSSLSDECLSSETDLFLEMLREHYDTKLRICVEGYNLTVSNVEAASQLVKKAIGGNPLNPNWFGEIEFSDQERSAAGLSQRSKHFVWLPLILSISRECAKKDSSIQRQLGKLYQEFYCFLDKQAIAVQKSRHEPDRSQRVYSIKWENKIPYIGSKGGYRPFTELYNLFPTLSASVPSDDC